MGEGGAGRGQARREKRWKFSTNEAYQSGPILLFRCTGSLCPEVLLCGLTGSHMLPPCTCQPGAWGQWGWQPLEGRRFRLWASEPLPSPAEVKEAQERGGLPLHPEKGDALKTLPEQHATNRGPWPPQKHILAGPAFVAPAFSSCSLSPGDFPDIPLLPLCVFFRPHVAPENSGHKMKRRMSRVIHSLPHLQPPRQNLTLEPHLGSAGSKRRFLRAHPSCCVGFLSNPDRFRCLLPEEMPHACDRLCKCVTVSQIPPFPRPLISHPSHIVPSAFPMAFERFPPPETGEGILRSEKWADERCSTV